VWVIIEPRAPKTATNSLGAGVKLEVAVGESSGVRNRTRTQRFVFENV
jgi:hypothetical protein